MTKTIELYRHLCEVCGKDEMLTLDEGFNKGWDMPPRMGVWGIISPRTCGNCSITDTVWWKITSRPEEALTVKDMETVERILAETGEPDLTATVND